MPRFHATKERLSAGAQTSIASRLSLAIFPLQLHLALPIMHVVKTIFIVLEVLLLFNLLIFVHELGHFLAARWRGLKVERFAVWFGKPIWMKKIGGVE